MALDVLITSNRISESAVARRFVEYLQENQLNIGLSNACLYYDFPTYSDYETVAHKPDMLLLSPLHGVIALHFVDVGGNAEDADASVLQFASILIGRLLKSRILRKSISTLKFAVSPVLVFPSNFQSHENASVEGIAIESLEGFVGLLKELESDDRMADVEVAEARSVIEGAKALSRPRPRPVSDPGRHRLALALQRLESDITNFDEKQRRAALITVPGPHRIRGLAGSGKTVIIAMKAAHLHLANPDSLILVTFYTKSLQASLKHLITKFFRNYKDEDPNWDKIHIRHGWGGASRAGTYSDACHRYNITSLTYPLAQQGAMQFALQNPGADRLEAFEFACRDLLKRADIQAVYDHVLIDEGQDFNSAFYELCYKLTKGERDRKNIVWAYDELQNILDIKIRSPEQLFGKDIDGISRVVLERAAQFLPPGSDNDTVLEKCYRNQREVLVTAHALGFGVYGTIVQMLESAGHWEDVGYIVETPNAFNRGQNVIVSRPEENSPISINHVDGIPTIKCQSFEAFNDEIAWVKDEIGVFIQEGLQPDDIIIISLDDRHAKSYFKAISSKLAEIGISSNNIIADPYNEPPFSISGRVTLSTVYRAKGNEAAVVFVVGAEAVALKSRLGRNKVFTALTRTKAWLRVSGIGASARALVEESRVAIQNFPQIKFIMPDLDRIDTIQRDLNARTIRVRKLRADYLRKLRAEGLEEDSVAEFLGETGLD